MSSPENKGEFMGTAATTAATSSRAFLAIFWAGLVCGVLDISQAFLASWLLRGSRPSRVLQSVASGLLGPDSFKGGAASATLGALLHFFIAFTVAAVFYLASRKLTFLIQRPVFWGMIYGELVFLFMNYIVIPLSAIHRVPPLKGNLGLILTGPIGHLFLVGLPIALIVRRYSV
jgi:hypothetical protein